jgi:hypothetical protein
MSGLNSGKNYIVHLIDRVFNVLYVDRNDGRRIAVLEKPGLDLLETG